MLLRFRKHRLYEDLYRCQYNLAGIYQRTGNLSQALRHVDVAIKCASKTKDKLAERESLILKGKVGFILTKLSKIVHVGSNHHKLTTANGGTFTSSSASLSSQSH